MSKPSRTRGHAGRELTIALLVLLIAAGCATAATMAWFSIADYARIRSMNVQITTGAALRFDLDAHPALEDYVTTLGFEEITARIQRERGFDAAETPLEPVTTNNYDTFTFEDGDPADPGSGAYLDFTLHFFSANDTWVHLTSANSKGSADGTRVTAEPAQLLQAMRLAFTSEGQTAVYTPGAARAASNPGGAKLFDLPAAEAMQLTEGSVHFMDHKESFFYYGSNQPPEFSSHDMGLFEYRSRQMKFWCLEKGKATKPQLLSIREEDYSFDPEQEDEVFVRIIPQAFGKQIITTVYLVGERFETGWMKQSLQLLCQGRRVFLGKNLFSKGACFAAMRKMDSRPPGFVYIGENEMKCNVSLKVYERGNISFYTLVTAGVPWFEVHSTCEVVIDGTPSIDFWIQQPNSREARIETVALHTLPERENRTTRMRIDAVPA